MNFHASSRPSTERVVPPMTNTVSWDLTSLWCHRRIHNSHIHPHTSLCTITDDPSKSQKRLWNDLCVTVRESWIKSCCMNSWLVHTGCFNTDRLYHISCYKEQENETVATNKQQPFSRPTWISHSLPSVSFLHLFQNSKLWAQVEWAFSGLNVIPVIKQTVSKHWRKHGRLTPAGKINHCVASFFLYPWSIAELLTERVFCPLALALWCQYLSYRLTKKLIIIKQTQKILNPTKSNRTPVTVPRRTPSKELHHCLF